MLTKRRAWDVIDGLTGRVVSRHRTRAQARYQRDMLARRYAVRRIYAE